MNLLSDAIRLFETNRKKSVEVKESEVPVEYAGELKDPFESMYISSSEIKEVTQSILGKA